MFTSKKKSKGQKRAREENSTSLNKQPQQKKHQSQKTALDQFPENVRHIVGSFLHHVPEANSTCRALLKLNGSNSSYIANARSYARLSPGNKLAYDVGSLACAVTRRLLTHGRGNVTQDIIHSHGKSAVHFFHNSDDQHH